MTIIIAQLYFVENNTDTETLTDDQKAAQSANISLTTASFGMVLTTVSVHRHT